MLRMSLRCILIYAIFLLLPYYGRADGSFQLVDIPIVSLIFLSLYDRSFFLFFQQKDRLLMFSVFLLLAFVLSHTMIILLNEVRSVVTGIRAANFYFLYGLMITIAFFGVIKDIQQSHGSQAIFDLLINALFVSFLIPISSYYHSRGFCKNPLSFYNPSQILLFLLMQFSAIYYLFFALKGSCSSKEKIKIFALLQLNLLMLTLGASRCGIFILPLYLIAMYFLFIRDRDIFSKNFIYYLIIIGIPSAIFIFYHVDKCTANWNQLITDIEIRLKKGELDQMLNNIGSTFFGHGLRLNKNELEFHSNFLEILYQSGMVNLLLYALSFVLIAYKLIRKGLLYALPFICFNLVSQFHFSQKSRFSWVFLAFTFLTLAVNQSKLSKNLK